MKNKKPENISFLPPINDIKPYCELMNSQSLSLIEIEIKNLRIKLEKLSNQSIFERTNVDNIPPKEDYKNISSLTTKNSKSDYIIKSPMVGTAYLAPDPNSKNFVNPGDKIKSGQILLIIEAMKVMNNITANKDSIVEKILVKDGQPVEFDQDLIILK